MTVAPAVTAEETEIRAWKLCDFDPASGTLLSAWGTVAWPEPTMVAECSEGGHTPPGVYHPCGVSAVLDRAALAAWVPRVFTADERRRLVLVELRLGGTILGAFYSSSEGALTAIDDPPSTVRSTSATITSITLPRSLAASARAIERRYGTRPRVINLPVYEPQVAARGAKAKRWARRTVAS